MADAVALNHWNGSDVRLGTVVDTMAQLRHSVARTASRTWVMTLVAVATSDDEVYQATQILRALGAHHPARLVILQPQPGPGAEGARPTPRSGRAVSTPT